MDKITEKISEKIDEISKKQEEQGRLIEELFNKLNKIKAKPIKSIKTFEELYKESFESFYGEIVKIQKELEIDDSSLIDAHESVEGDSIYFHLASCLIYFDLKKISYITAKVNEATANNDYVDDGCRISTYNVSDLAGEEAFFEAYKKQIKELYDIVLSDGEATKDRPIKIFQIGRFHFYSALFDLNDSDSISDQLYWVPESGEWGYDDC